MGARHCNFTQIGVSRKSLPLQRPEPRGEAEQQGQLRPCSPRQMHLELRILESGRRTRHDRKISQWDIRRSLDSIRVLAEHGAVRRPDCSYDELRSPAAIEL